MWIKLVIPILLVAIVIAILGNMLQQKWMVTAKPLQPKFSKISPISGFKRMFSVRQLVELINIGKWNNTITKLKLNRINVKQ